jgi:hypothetical protein
MRAGGRELIRERQGLRGKWVVRGSTWYSSLKKTFGSGWFVGIAVNVRCWISIGQLGYVFDFYAAACAWLIDITLYILPSNSNPIMWFIFSNKRKKQEKKKKNRSNTVHHPPYKEKSKPIEWEIEKQKSKKSLCLLMTARGYMWTARLVSSYSFPCFPSNSLRFPCTNFLMEISETWVAWILLLEK